MKSKKTKEHRNFSPIRVSDSLKKINQKILYKFGKIDYIIHVRWLEIVGSFFEQNSEPMHVISVPKSTNKVGNIEYTKYLQVNVTPSIAIEFQHFQNKIIENINSFFGYKAIHGLKIHQKLIKKNNIEKTKINISNQNTKIELKKIKNTTSKINDKELQESLIKLGISITNKK